MVYQKISLKYKTKIIAMSLVLIIFLGSFCNLSMADNISTYEKELEQVKQEQKENSIKLTGIEKELALYAYEIADYDSQMLDYSKEIAKVQEDIDEADEKLKELEETLANSDQEYSILQDSYAKRLRTLYENGIPSIFDIYLKSSTLTEFFLKMEIYTTVLEYDKNNIGRFKNKKEYVDYVKEDIEFQKLQLENLKAEKEEAFQVLEGIRESKNERLTELQTTQQELVANSDLLTQKKKEAIQQIDDEVARVIKEAQNDILNGTSTTFTGGDFVWPVSGYTTITTRFGEIYNLVDPAGSAHTGADISGSNIMGTPIRAIEAGKVTTAKYSNYGYGNNVIINHGQNTTDNNNYISLYGHCSSLNVEQGDMVEKGDIIGYVGSTGNSTGPHLHLEIRINGVLTDPLEQYPAIQFYFPYL